MGFDERNYNAQVALCGIDVQRSPSLVDSHIMCVVDVDVDGLNRVMTDGHPPVQRVWPTP